MADRVLQLGDPRLRRVAAALERATAELLQHELDHLDGVLAVDRATGPAAIVTRAAYAADRARLDATVG